MLGILGILLFQHTQEYQHDQEHQDTQHDQTTILLSLPLPDLD